MSIRCSVGMYKPVGVDNAMLMSVCGRSVSVGFSDADGADADVIEERKRGHSSIAFERVLRKRGRYVSLLNCAEDSRGGGDGWE